MFGGTSSLQNPSFMSHFARKSGLSSGKIVAIAVINRGSAFLSWSMACWMAHGFVRLLTLGRRMPASISWKDRSRIGRKGLLLCGIAARGLIFRLLGGLSFISSHRTNLASPASTFSIVSARRQAMASNVHVEGWFPRSTAAVMCSCDHGGPQSTGHPFLA